MDGLRLPYHVALRKESVDRNVYAQGQVAEKAVALRKESVDRNRVDQDRNVSLTESLSARRAWIEISTQCKL